MSLLYLDKLSKCFEIKYLFHEIQVVLDRIHHFDAKGAALYVEGLRAQLGEVGVDFWAYVVLGNLLG